jgi:hypothetical protein
VSAGLALGLAMGVGCKGSPTAPEEQQTETVTLEFVSDVRGTADSGSAVHAAVHSAFRLTLDTSLPHDQTVRTYRGSGPLDWTIFSFDNPNPSECANPSFSTQGSVFTVQVLLKSIFPGSAPSVDLEFDSGHPLENVTLVCGGVPGTLYGAVPGFWETSFRALHASEIRGNAYSVIGGVALPSGPGFIAVKNYVRTVPASHGTLAEATTLTVTVGK